MTALIYLLLALSLPFMLGIVAGIEIVKRRRAPQSTDERLGKIIRDRVEGVMAQRQWIGEGSGFAVSNTLELNLSGRTVEIIVKEVA